MFDIHGSKIKLNTDDLAVPPFREHYNKAKNKSEALKEIEYIVWLYKWDTPYNAYAEEDRESIVAKDVFGNEKYKPTKEVEELIKRFQEFQETPGTRMLKTAQQAAEGVQWTLRNYSNNMGLDDAIKVTRILKDAVAVSKQLDIALKQAKAEQSETGRIQGGGKIGLYEI